MKEQEFIKKYKIKDKEYFNIIKELLENEDVLKMDTYIQHGKTTTLDHCIKVSFSAYKRAKLFKLDYKSTARAALLHDFYLYDWHDIHEKQKLYEMHGYTHPKIAYNNAKERFNLNDKEKDIIIKHMWPLTLRQLPKYKESALVSYVDKKSTIDEFFNPKVKKVVQVALLLIGIRIK